MTPFIFGLQANTLADPNSYFRQIANKQNKPNLFTAVLKEVCPRLVNSLNISSMNADVTKFFYSLTTEAVRLKADSNRAFYHDLISVMLEMKHRKPRPGTVQTTVDESPDASLFYNTFESTFLVSCYLQFERGGRGSDGVQGSAFFRTSEFIRKFILCAEFDERLMSAQCFIMFMAGFKPSSFLMNCLWLEVAKNGRTQERLQEEIAVVLARYDGELTFESLFEMTYMDQVISGKKTFKLYESAPVWLSIW